MISMCAILCATRSCRSVIIAAACVSCARSCSLFYSAASDALSSHMVVSGYVSCAQVSASSASCVHGSSFYIRSYMFRI